MEDEDTKLSPALKAGLGDLLESGLFSDFQIRCRDGSVYKVHKAIFCAQSTFFKNALNPASNFVESQTNTVKLENDDPDAVAALVEYMYRFKYINPETSVEQLLVFHAQIYAMGEKYRLQDLKDLAKSRFKKTFMDSGSLQKLGFPQAIRVVYSTTIESDRGLRDLVVTLTNGFMDSFLKMREFLAVMDEVASFSKDLALALVAFIPRRPNYVCFSCGREVQMGLPAAQENVHCVACGESSGMDNWTCTLSPNDKPLRKFCCPDCKIPVAMELQMSTTYAPCCGLEMDNFDWALEEIRGTSPPAT